MATGTKLIRSELEILKTRMNQEPRKLIQVIYGPRQTGKTTLIIQFSKRTSLTCHVISADEPSTNESSWIHHHWEIVRQKMRQEAQKEAILIIDDVEKITNWSEQVRKEWDTDTQNGLSIKVILSGATNAFSEKDFDEILKGKFEKVYVGHWTFSEMNAAFGYSPEEYAWFGGYPGAAAFKNDENQWKSFVRDSLFETTIHKDILMRTRIDKPSLLKRLFELGCQHSSQVLSLTKIMGQLHDAGNTTTLSHYLHLLNTAGLLNGLEKYSPGKSRQRGSIPKFQVQNTALMTATQSESFSTILNDPAKWGRWIESCIGAHLLNACMKNNFMLHYWKHVNDEIDFVLSNGKKTIGIEVNTAFKQRKSGIQAFSKTHPPGKTLVLGTGGISWQEFIKTDPSTLL